MPNKKVFLASDHTGFELKEALLPYLQERGFEVEHLGPTTLNAADDYPQTVLPLALKVAENKGTFGIVIGASGQGEAMECNRVKGVRAAVYYGPAPKSQTDLSGKTLDMLASTREHNNANVLSLAARFISAEDAKEAVVRWLLTEFPGEERHRRRIAELG